MEYDPHKWYMCDIPTDESMQKYLLNVQKMRSVVTAMNTTPEAPAQMKNLSFDGANAIEKILLDLEWLLDRMPATYQHCGAAICGTGGLML